MQSESNCTCFLGKPIWGRLFGVTMEVRQLTIFYYYTRDFSRKMGSTPLFGEGRVYYYIHILCCSVNGNVKRYFALQNVQNLYPRFWSKWHVIYTPYLWSVKSNVNRYFCGKMEEGNAERYFAYKCTKRVALKMYKTGTKFAAYILHGMPFSRQIL